MQVTTLLIALLAAAATCIGRRSVNDNREKFPLVDKHEYSSRRHGSLRELASVLLAPVPAVSSAVFQMASPNALERRSATPAMSFLEAMIYSLGFRPKDPIENAKKIQMTLFSQGCQLPAFDVLRNEGTGWEIRKYQAMVVAEVNYNEMKTAMNLLDGYSSGGLNEFGFPIPKTWPIMTIPGNATLRTPQRMRYMLPQPHTPLDPTGELVDGPAGVRPGITVKKIPSVTVAVGVFDDYPAKDIIKKCRDEMVASMREAGIVIPDPNPGSVMGPGESLALYGAFNSMAGGKITELWIPIEM